MKQFTCDICRRESNDCELRTVSEELATDSIKHACKECYSELSHAERAIYEITARLKWSWMRRALAALMDKFKQGGE